MNEDAALSMKWRLKFSDDCSDTGLSCQRRSHMFHREARRWLKERAYLAATITEVSTPKLVLQAVSSFRPFGSTTTC